jgi:hypothetical protein
VRRNFQRSEIVLDLPEHLRDPVAWSEVVLYLREHVRDAGKGIYNLDLNVDLRDGDSRLFVDDFRLNVNL